jgi:hypothetical protein
MFPLSYGPFKDEESAREWVRQRGITRATRLMERSAVENIKVPPVHFGGSLECREHIGYPFRLLDRMSQEIK